MNVVKESAKRKMGNGIVINYDITKLSLAVTCNNSNTYKRMSQSMHHTDTHLYQVVVVVYRTGGTGAGMTVLKTVNPAPSIVPIKLPTCKHIPEIKYNA